MTDPFSTPERRALRDMVRRFVQHDVLPYQEVWEREGELPRSLHQRAASLGLIGLAYPASVGGGGGDAVDALVRTEEFHYAGGASGVFASLFTSGIALPHLVAAGDHLQIDRWVRPTIDGAKIGALAITEPDGGSDVANLRTAAEREGNDYIVNGAKTYITSGERADFVVTAVRTGDAGAHGISLLVVEKGTPGFTVSRKLDKMGWLASDTAELSYADVRVPASNLVGPQNSGFTQLAQHFVSERIGLAVQCFAKNTAVQAGGWVVDQAVQLHGGMGYLRESEVERQYRDMRIMGIGGGTTEILIGLAAKTLGYTS